MLTKYLIEVGFQFNYLKNDKRRITIVCSMRLSNGRCMWRVDATLEDVIGYFYTRTLDNIHTCSAVVRTDKNPRATSTLIRSLIVNEIHDNSLTRAIEVKKQMKKEVWLNNKIQ